MCDFSIIVEVLEISYTRVLPLSEESHQMLQEHSLPLLVMINHIKCPLKDQHLHGRGNKERVKSTPNILSPNHACEIYFSDIYFQLLFQQFENEKKIRDLRLWSERRKWLNSDSTHYTSDLTDFLWSQHVTLKGVNLNIPVPCKRAWVRHLS